MHVKPKPISKRMFNIEGDLEDGKVLSERHRRKVGIRKFNPSRAEVEAAVAAYLAEGKEITIIESVEDFPDEMEYHADYFLMGN